MRERNEGREKRKKGGRKEERGVRFETVKKEQLHVLFLCTYNNVKI